MISLDLVIRNTIGKQLEAIKASIKQPVEDMRQQISKGVQDTVQSVADGAKAAMQQSMDEVKKTTEQTTDYIDNLIDKALAPKVAAPKVEPIEMPEVKPSKKTTVSVGYDPEAMSFMEEYGEKLKAKAGEISDEMREKLGNFEISADPTERIEQQMDNLRNKIALTQKHWQELMYAWNNADPGSKAFDNLDGKLNSTEKQLLSLQSQYDKLEEVAKASVAKMADETKAKVSELTDEMREKLGNFEISKDPAERIQQQMSVLTDKISVTQKRWQELAYALENTDPGSKDFDKLTASLSNAENRLISLQSQYEKLEGKANKPAKSVKSMAAKAGASIKNALSGAFNHVKKVGAKALSGLRSGFSSVGKSVKGLFKPIANLGKKIKQTFKRVFLFAGILAAVKALKSGIGDVMNQNEAFQKSLNDVKANLAIAFTPIINTVMPILTKLMQGVATVSKYVAGFIASLFGQTYQQAAQATKKLKGTSAEAKKAKQSLAGIDEINTLSSGKDDESSSDSGGIDYSSLDMSEPEYPDWAKSLKDSILSGDWAGVGKTLGEKVTSVLTGIPWTDLGRKFSESVNSIFSGINSFFKNTDWGGIVKDMTEGLNAAVSGTDWALIGDTLASGLSAIIDSAYAFVTTFDFSGFGSGLGDSVNAFFAGIDWSKAAETLSGAITGLLDSLIGFLETVDWQAIGEDIYTFISSIDWSGILGRVARLIGSIIGTCWNLALTGVKAAIKGIKDYFSKKIEEAGGSVISGLWKGIKDALGNAWQWIKTNIFQPFLDGFKKCFGIHSPSTVMAEMGDYIIQGLYNAVSGGIEKVKKIFRKILNTIKDVFTGIGGWFKQTFTEVFTNVKAVLQSIISFITSVFAGNWSSAWNSIKKAFQSVWDGMVTVVKIPINLIISSINKMTGAVESAVNSIIDGLNTLSFDIPDWVPKIGGSRFGFDLGHIDIPEIPKLASGGLATAPTLAMVGDNRNASVDPEVIAPLSKLTSMLGSTDPAVLALLGEILEAIKEKQTVVSIDSNAIGRASAAYTHGKAVRV
jgi:phage-related protein